MYPLFVSHLEKLSLCIGSRPYDIGISIMPSLHSQQYSNVDPTFQIRPSLLNPSSASVAFKSVDWFLYECNAGT